ncbi:hypothetical protein ACIGXI_01645 [Kitasatospora aureofaciens]|uniref:hypothetical protein n=1 Tax=Kitasatospora aureofaciens TaxID=1894 RepID=UPI0037C669F3
MDTVTVLEPDTPTNVRLLGTDQEPVDPQDPVRLAHTAPADASGVCGPLTLCGRDTSDMTLAPHRTTIDGRPWPYWAACGMCRDADRSATPDTSEEDIAPEEDVTPGEDVTPEEDVAPG